MRHFNLGCFQMQQRKKAIFMVFCTWNLLNVKRYNALTYDTYLSTMRTHGTKTFPISHRILLHSLFVIFFFSFGTKIRLLHVQQQQCNLQCIQLLHLLRMLFPATTKEPKIHYHLPLPFDVMKKHFLKMC